MDKMAASFRVIFRLSMMGTVLIYYAFFVYWLFFLYHTFILSRRKKQTNFDKNTPLRNNVKQDLG